MEIPVDVVIVGAGIAGLTTSLGLYRYPQTIRTLPCIVFVASYVLEDDVSLTIKE